MVKKEFMTIIEDDFDLIWESARKSRPHEITFDEIRGG